MKMSWDLWAVAALLVVLGSLIALIVFVPDTRSATLPVVLLGAGSVLQAFRGRAVKKVPRTPPPPTQPPSMDVH